MVPDPRHARLRAGTLGSPCAHVLLAFAGGGRARKRARASGHIRAVSGDADLVRVFVLA